VGLPCGRGGDRAGGGGLDWEDALTRADVVQVQIDAILRREAWPTYSNRAADLGHETKGGVTLAALSADRGRPVTVAELKALTEPEARDFYHRRYIKPWEFVPDADLFAVLVDYAVTSWHDDPTKALQEKLGVPVDGKLGPITRAAVIAADPAALRSYVLAHRIRKFIDLALNDPPMRVFIAEHPEAQIRNLRGWIRRVTDFMRT